MYADGPDTDSNVVFLKLAHGSRKRALANSIRLSAYQLRVVAELEVR
jgi:hypothetical protein